MSSYNRMKVNIVNYESVQVMEVIHDTPPPAVAANIPPGAILFGAQSKLTNKPVAIYLTGGPADGMKSLLGLRPAGGVAAEIPENQIVFRHE